VCLRAKRADRGMVGVPLAGTLGQWGACERSEQTVVW
jgi:hypothetical protein